MEALRMLARMVSCLLLPAGNLALGFFLGRQLVRSGWPEMTTPIAALLGVVVGFFLSWREIREALREQKK